MIYDADELIRMARAAERDDRLSTGALYGKLADALEQEIGNWKRRNRDACELAKALKEAERFMTYFAGEQPYHFVGPGTPTSCLTQIRDALRLVGSPGLGEKS
jgi:hypothetical protein